MSRKFWVRVLEEHAYDVLVEADSPEEAGDKTEKYFTDHDPDLESQYRDYPLAGLAWAGKTIEVIGDHVEELKVKTDDDPYIP